jgi:hypothetical protein
VDWARCPLRESTFERLNSVWQAALSSLGARNGRALCLDGVSYHFANRTEAAMTHSPGRGSACAELVGLGEALIDLARLKDEGDRPAREEDLITRADHWLERVR